MTASAKDGGPLVLQVSRISYAIGVGCWVIGSFALVWMMMLVPLIVSMIGLAGLAIVGVFSAFGLVRPKRISLAPDELVFRPVIGRERRILRSDISCFEEIWPPVVSAVLVTCCLRRARAYGVKT